MQYLFNEKNRKCHLFHFCCCLLLFDFLKYASLSSLIKLESILRKYAASERQCF